VSVTDWRDEFLDSLRTQADPAADAVVAGLFEGTADATSAFRALVVEHNEVSDPALAAFLETKDDVPDWVDPDLVAAGQECFAPGRPHVHRPVCGRTSEGEGNPSGRPRAPEVNFTKFPGASVPPGRPDVLHSLNGCAGTGPVDRRAVSPGSHNRWMASVRAHMVPIWARYSSASMPRAGWGATRGSCPDWEAPKSVARQ